MIYRFTHNAAECKRFFLFRADGMRQSLPAQMLDGGIFFIAADAGKIVTRATGDGSGQLAAFFAAFGRFRLRRAHWASSG